MNSVYAVSLEGSIVYYDGSGWSTVYSDSSSRLRDIWGSSGSDIHVVGSKGVDPSSIGQILHFDESTWIPHCFEDTDSFQIISWQDSLDAVADFNTRPEDYAWAEYDPENHQKGWRVPNKIELRSIMDRSRQVPWLKIFQKLPPLISAVILETIWFIIVCFLKFFNLRLLPG